MILKDHFTGEQRKHTLQFFRGFNIGGVGVGPELQLGLRAKCEAKTKKPQKHIYGHKLSICLLGFCVSHHDIETNASKLSFVFASCKLP